MRLLELPVFSYSSRQPGTLFLNLPSDFIPAEGGERRCLGQQDQAREEEVGGRQQEGRAQGEEEKGQGGQQAQGLRQGSQRRENYRKSLGFYAAPNFSMFFYFPCGTYRSSS